MNDRKTNLLTGLIISIFFAFTVLFYGPLSQYLSNAGELWFSLKDILKIIVPVSVMFVILASLIFFVLPPGVSSFLLKLFFGGALALYIQGNYIKADYGTGVLDGTEIDWSSYRGYGYQNLLLWAVCIILPFVISAVLKKKKQQIGKILIIASLFLTVIQIPALAVQAVSYHPNENTDLKLTTEGMFELSSRDNVLVFIIDTVDEAYYQTFAENNPDFTELLDGFIHYDNTLSSGSRTTIGVPSMLTGIPYKKQCVYSEYLQNIYASENPLSILYDAGYRIGVYSKPILFSTDAAGYVENFSDEGGKIGSRKIFLKKIYKLDLFKFVPHFLKKYVWFNTAEFDEARGDETDYKINDAEFIAAYRESAFSYTADADKIMRVYHLNGAHAPYTLGVDGTKASGGTLEEQVAGCLNCVKEMLTDLKEQGVYDRSTIIITADHGDYKKAQHPFFLVKASGDTEAYRTSHVPASLYDMPIFLAGIAGKELEGQTYGLPLESLQEGMERERRMFHNKTNDNQFIIEEFKTTAAANDYDQLELVTTYEETEDETTPYALGTKLSFTVDATGNKYCVEGIGANTGFRSRLHGPHAVFSIPIADLPENGSLRVHFGMHAVTVTGTNVIIYANDHEVFNDVIDDAVVSEGLEFDVPVSVFDGTSVLTLKFDFPDIPEDEMELKVQKRTETISLMTLVITAIEYKGSTFLTGSLLV